MSQCLKITLCVLALMTVRCAKDSGAETSAATGGQLSTETINHDGLDREYLIYRPKSANGSTNLPW